MTDLKVGDRVQAHVLHLTTPIRVVGTIKDMTDMWVELEDGRVISKNAATKIEEQ